MDQPYLICSDLEKLRKSDFCYICKEIMAVDSDIYLIRFSHEKDSWAKAHRACIEKEDNPAWIDYVNSKYLSKKKTTLVGSKYGSLEDRYKLFTVAPGHIVDSQKYLVMDEHQDDMVVYATSRKEKAMGAIECLNSLNTI